MGCSCGSGVRAFQIEIDDKKYILYGLDQVVFSTIILSPETDEEAAKELWNGLQTYSEIAEENKESLQKILLDIYKTNKKAYES